MQESRFSVKDKKNDGIAYIYFEGDLSFNLEEVLPGIIDKYINSGCIKFLFNFEKAITVNSPAVATILTQTEKIVDDHGGRLSVTGLSNIYEKVFEMVGVFLYASLCTNEAEAIEDLKD